MLLKDYLQSHLSTAIGVVNIGSIKRYYRISCTAQVLAHKLRVFFSILASAVACKHRKKKKKKSLIQHQVISRS